MGIDALKQQLTDGKLTKEQFATELKKLLDAGSITQEEHDAAASFDVESGQGSGAGSNDNLSMDEIRKMIQSETDKVRTEYAKKLKQEQDELEKLKTEKMSEAEKAKYELDKLQKENEQKAVELTKREVALHTVDQLRQKELPIEFREILAGSSVDDTNERITAFESQWKKALNDAVESRFKGLGSNPNSGRDNNQSGTGPNPFDAKTRNLTQQAMLIRDNPDKARALAAAAGITLQGL